MDARDLTRPPADPATAAIVTAYLAELHRRSPAGRRERGRIAAEIADGLGARIADLVARGVPARSAARRAVREFGDPATVARAFAGRLGPIAAHRAGVGLVVTGPFVGLAWIVALAGVATGWTAGLGRVVTALPMLPVLLVITVPAALVAAAGAGRLARRTARPGPPGPRRRRCWPPAPARRWTPAC